MKKLFSVCCLLMCTQVLAESCNDLEVSIANVTEHNCRLIAVNFIHGELNSTTIPEVIAPNTSRSFMVTTTGLYGPSLMVAYDCGCDGSVNIVSSQNYCLFKAADVTGSVNLVNDLQADYTVQPGDWNMFSHGLHGAIHWSISKR